MKIRASLLGMIGAVIVAAGTPAWAQVPGAGASPLPLPLVVPLKKIPIGSWSEYVMNDGKRKITMRVALVSRDEKTAQIENQVEGLFQGGARTVVRMSLPLNDAAEVMPSELVLQMGQAAPMLMPQAAYVQKFRRVDAAKRVGVEDVQVAAGKFAKADHHRETASVSAPIDYWIAKEVLPFGLVKTVSTPPGGGPPVVMELAARGSGAKGMITQKAVPFDAAALAAAMQGGGAAPAPGAGTPQRGVPSPHPGMPPTAPGATPAAKKK
jgi:hypothetical protein